MGFYLQACRWVAGLTHGRDCRLVLSAAVLLGSTGHAVRVWLPLRCCCWLGVVGGDGAAGFFCSPLSAVGLSIHLPGLGVDTATAWSVDVTADYVVVMRVTGCRCGSLFTTRLVLKMCATLVTVWLTAGHEVVAWPVVLLGERWKWATKGSPCYLLGNTCWKTRGHRTAL